MKRFTTLWLAALSACSAPEPSATLPPPSAVDGDLSTEPCIYEAGDAAYPARCGWLTVPENRSDPASRLIHLPVRRVLASGSSPYEPIYYLAGGPGASNLSFSRLEGLIEGHEIVMVGYRGADGPVRLDCPEYSAMLSDPPDGFFSRGAFDASVETYRQCARRLAEEGVDLAGYTAVETVRDLEAARIAFGDARVNVLSQSYGTRLAMLWDWAHPSSLHRSAMISVNPPGHFIWDPWMIERQLGDYSELCARDEDCAARTASLLESMRTVAESMPERWLLLPIKPDNIKLLTFMMLYHTTSAAKILDAWLDAAEGDPSGLATLSVMADLMFASAPSIWGESVAKVTSLDYEWEPGRDYLTEFNPEGTVLGAGVSTMGFAGALGWPGNLADESLRKVQPSDLETLLISGSIDLSTPMEYARDELLPHLENGHQVVLREFGHTGDVWSLQPEATRHLLTTFFATGEVDASKFVPHVVSFDAGLGFGTMARLGLTLLAVLLIAFLLALWWLVRRWRRKRIGGLA